MHCTGEIWLGGCVRWYKQVSAEMRALTTAVRDQWPSLLSYRLHESCRASGTATRARPEERLGGTNLRNKTANHSSSLAWGVRVSHFLMLEWMYLDMDICCVLATFPVMWEGRWLYLDAENAPVGDNGIHAIHFVEFRVQICRVLFGEGLVLQRMWKGARVIWCEFNCSCSVCYQSGLQSW